MPYKAFMNMEIYKIGDRVTVAGIYVCVPCGYRRKFTAGEIFPACMGCMKTSRPIEEAMIAGSEERGEEVNEFDEDAYAPNLEIWELIGEEAC